MERRTDFCTECRQEREYQIKQITVKETIKDKQYEFLFTKAFCEKCGMELSVPGLLDLNIKERDEQYRQTEGIIAIEDIKKIMSIYHIGKAPLSLALGFGEVTISRYLEGQMPSKHYSDIMRSVLASPKNMVELLNHNKEKVGDTAYRKAVEAALELEDLFKISDKMSMSIAYIFEQMQEVTPLALQKILYYIQGVYMALFDMPLFPENCCAWQHGPVYEKVYSLFRDFKYDPIDDNRFVLLAGKTKELSETEKTVINLVIKTFGRYSGKVLENITHNEKPWREARKGYGMNERSNIIIPKEHIESYFKEISEKYRVDSIEGLNNYINAQLAVNSSEQETL